MGNEIIKIIEERLLSEGSFKEIANRQTSVLAEILLFDSRERLATIAFIDPSSGNKTVIEDAEVPLKNAIWGRDYKVGDIVLATFASGSLQRPMIVARYRKRDSDGTAEEDTEYMEDKNNPSQDTPIITF